MADSVIPLNASLLWSPRTLEREDLNPLCTHHHAVILDPATGTLDVEATENCGRKGGAVTGADARCSKLSALRRHETFRF